jgi:uncharacterized protein
MAEQENIQLAQEAYAAFGRGDLPALADAMADDIGWVSPGDPGVDPTAGTYNGKEAVLAWFGTLAENVDFQVFEPREFIAQGDRVASVVYAEATVRSTGRSFVNSEVHLWTFRGGKVAHLQIYYDTAAVAAAYRGE